MGRLCGSFQKAKTAIEILVTSGIDVQLYNFPLCAVEHDYWRLAAKSITEYKIRYMEACDECSVKPICGGFLCLRKGYASRSTSGKRGKMMKINYFNFKPWKNKWLITNEQEGMQLFRMKNSRI